MKKPTVLTIGSATFDIFAKAHDSAIMHFDTPDSRKAWLCVQHGGKLNVEEVHETFGGGATNTAIGFARMGFDVACLTKVGTLYGERVLQNMLKEGVEVRHIKPTEKAQTALSVVLNSFEGERTILYHRGANALLSARDIPADVVSLADWIYLNHISSTRHATGIHKKVLSMLKQHPSIQLAWNPGHEQLKEGAAHWRSLLRHTDILFLNKQEAAEFSGKPFYKNTLTVESEDRHERPCAKSCRFLAPGAYDLREIFRELFRHGPRMVVITDGQNGSQASDGKTVSYCPVISRRRVDTLGAGDGFGTGFTAARILGKPLKEALICGTLNAGSVVQYYGAQQGLMTRGKLLQKLSKTAIRIHEGKL